MKVLHIVTNLWKIGGVSVAVPEIASAQLAAGLIVGIAYCDSGELSDAAVKAMRKGVRMHPFRPEVGPLRRVWFSWDLVRRLEAVARNYDIIFVHAAWQFPIWWGSHVARKLGKPYIVMPHGSFSSNALLISKWKKSAAGLLERYAVRRSLSVWTTSEIEADDVWKYVPGVRTSVFPVGLNVDDFGLAPAIPGSKKILLYFSRISPVKGLDLLAAAWGQDPPDGWKLVIAGPDDRGYTEEIKGLYAETCRAGSYEFRGPVYGDLKYSLLRSASAFVLPTRSENWGVVVAEAMASRLPVICTKGAPWRCLTEMGAGWWTDVSADGLRESIRAMAAMSDYERKAMGERGRKWVERELDWKPIGRKMSDWLNEHVGMTAGADN